MKSEDPLQAWRDASPLEIDPPLPAKAPDTVARLTARLAAAERDLAARDEIIKALRARESDGAGKEASSHGFPEQQAALQEAVAHKTVELEAQSADLRRTRNALEETSGLLELLFENMPLHMYFKDEQSRFVYYSKSLQDALDPTGAVPLKGKSDFDFFTEPFARETFAEEQRIFHSGQPMVGKAEKSTRAGGEIFWSVATKMPWRDKSGRIIGTFGISVDITSIKLAEARLEEAHIKLVEASRLAGMAEVATSVLHNVGNVLNSVNISASVAANQIRNSSARHLGSMADLMEKNAENLGAWLTGDPVGAKLPAFIGQLARQLESERATVLEELGSLEKNIEHIKDIVAMQQNYATAAGVSQTVAVVDLVEDCVKLNAGALTRHDVQLIRDFKSDLVIEVDKHKVVQILINLIRNAKYACDEAGRQDKQMTLRVTNDAQTVRVAVIDNGVGIPQENMTRIFSHGFTTRATGHGFGLHSSALAARELGGALLVHSDGPGLGATFTLEFPLKLSKSDYVP